MGGRRWWIAGLLFLSTMLNYFDRQILALVSPVLRIDFSLSAVEYSHLLNAFLLGYTCMQLLAGWLVDRIGARRGLMLAMLWWSGAGAAAAATRGPSQLGVCLFLMGWERLLTGPQRSKLFRSGFHRLGAQSQWDSSMRVRPRALCLLPLLCRDSRCTTPGGRRLLLVVRWVCFGSARGGLSTAGRRAGRCLSLSSGAR